MTDRVTPEALRLELLGDLVAVLYCEPADVDDNTPFVELGLDSILGIEFVTIINGRYQLTETIDAIYENPTLTRLVEYLSARLERTPVERG